MKVSAVAFSTRCGDSYNSACKKYCFTVSSFIVLSLPLFFLSYLSLACPFCLIYFLPAILLSPFPHLSFPFSPSFLCRALLVTGARGALVRERTMPCQLLTPSSLAYLAASTGADEKFTLPAKTEQLKIIV